MKPFNLDEYIKNPSRELITRSGKHVRIICIDKEGNDYPIIALVKDNYGESILTYKIDGRQYISQDSSSDLFFKTEKKVGWINIYKTDNHEFKSGYIYNSKTEAKESILNNNKYIDTVTIVWEE